MFTEKINRRSTINYLTLGCNKSTAVVGEVINLSATPGNGPTGISYTIKYMKQIGNGISTIINTQTSTGNQVNFNYTVATEDNNNNVQFWADGTYVCPSDNSVRNGSSGRCNVVIGSITPLKWKCSGAPNYQCIQATDGIYNTAAECQVACGPQQIKKFKVYTIGNSANPSGVLVMRNSDYTADEACKIVCETLNKM